MSQMKAWMADCNLQDRGTPDSELRHSYSCPVAVWANSYESLRAGLMMRLETTSYQLESISQCCEAHEYVNHKGIDEARITELANSVNVYHMVELGPFIITGVVEPELSEESKLTFKEALLKLDYKTAPVFGVLDGAQFDNLPKNLFDGDFISRPLYLDRGENDPEQIITAPHMVTLDERAENVTGRSYAETLEALLELIDNKPAAVFWQCPEGRDVLYKHLRGINMVRLPKMALPIEEREFVEEDHSTVLFRHADANALMQVLSGLNQAESSRLYGPARRLIFLPGDVWYSDCKVAVADWSERWPASKSGMLVLSTHTMEHIEKTRERGLQKWAVLYFSDPDTEGFDPSYTVQIKHAYTRAASYGFEHKEDLWDFIRLDLTQGENFEKKRGYEEVFDALTEEGTTPSLRIFYALRACEELKNKEEP